VTASRTQISVDFTHVTCDWRPLGYNLNATGRQLHAKFACAIVASCLQSRQFFASTLREQLFELKNEDAI
jgi:hypothetical protein